MYLQEQQFGFGFSFLAGIGSGDWLLGIHWSLGMQLAQQEIQRCRCSQCNWKIASECSEHQASLVSPAYVFG